MTFRRMDACASTTGVMLVTLGVIAVLDSRVVLLTASASVVLVTWIFESAVVFGTMTSRPELSPPTLPPTRSWVFLFRLMASTIVVTLTRTLSTARSECTCCFSRVLSVAWKALF